MTYKVFIVEDEHLIRETLRNQVIQLGEQLPITYCGEAGDGEMALAAITELLPDIILTDIKMPFMDGLEFSKEARKLLPWSRIIFLSGFDDFEFAKIALQVQADDYLLKPIKNQELFQTLNKVVTLLDQQKRTTFQQPSKDMILELKKNHFLNGLFNGKLTLSDALQQSESFSRSFVGKKMTVLLANNRFNQNFEDYAHFTEYLNYLFQNNESLLFSSVSSRFIKFLIFDSTKEKVLEIAYQLAQTLIHELEQNDTDEISVAIGSVVSRISEVPSSFEIARDMLGTYGYLRTEKIFSYEDDMKEGELSPTHPFKLDLATEISKLQDTDISDFIQKLSIDQSSSERTRMYRFFILTELTSLVQKKKNIPENIREKLRDIDQLVLLASNRHDYQQILDEIIHYLIDIKIHPSMSKYQSVIAQALTFIKQNYTNPDISLNMVAEEVSLSPAHFSTIFSQSLGKTFIDYLTDQRIQHAKKILAETNHRLSEIALEIGYNDPNYFSFLFKKKQGVSPTEYRQNK
ncbi:response regulator transcription factor [Enterococcus massiliensis]|uniref:response regulator transcription factor n=1 Tax=Enterococcus massiliensis TaxID=1640685 RepID=UPI00065E7FA0|nr:response regulator [Enterococcus massiliensis]